MRCFFIQNSYFLSLVTFVTEITGKMWYYYDAGDKNLVFYFRLMKILIKTANAYICVHDRRFIMVKEVNIRKVAVIGCGFCWFYVCVYIDAEQSFFGDGSYRMRTGREPREKHLI